MRIPFVPTIYEHAAALINKTPSQVAINEELIVKAHLKAYELYSHDLISVGIDIYNIEAQALGAKVRYYEDETLPSILKPLITSHKMLDEINLPNPYKDGRMSIFAQAAGRIRKEVPKNTFVSGTITGPFTLACILRGFENFIDDILDEPEFAFKLLNFTKNVGLEYAKAYKEQGVNIAINESFIAPPLCSPSFYNEFAWGAEKDMINTLKQNGFSQVALISGGNTTKIVEDMLKTGTSLIMADEGCDLAYYKKLCKNHNTILRASINPQIVKRGNEEEMRQAVELLVEECADYEKIIFGCGIVSFDTPSENVVLLKNVLEQVCLNL